MQIDPPGSARLFGLLALCAVSLAAADGTHSRASFPPKEILGKRATTSLGAMLLPNRFGRRSIPLVIEFHGDPAFAEWSVRQRSRNAAVLAIQLGVTSDFYSKAFEEKGRFTRLLAEAKKAAGVEFHPVVLTSFSAGYGAVREILQDRANWPEVDGVLLMDSLHTGYTANSKVDPQALQMFLDYAQEAVAGRKRMLITHSEIIPGTFASTTETADYLLTKLGLQRIPAKQIGPAPLQARTHVRKGQFEVIGFAGSSAQDHAAHFDAMAEWLRRFRIN